MTYSNPNQSPSAPNSQSKSGEDLTVPLTDTAELPTVVQRSAVLDKAPYYAYKPAERGERAGGRRFRVSPSQKIGSLGVGLLIGTGLAATGNLPLLSDGVPQSNSVDAPSDALENVGKTGVPGGIEGQPAPDFMAGGEEPTSETPTVTAVMPTEESTSTSGTIDPNASTTVPEAGDSITSITEGSGESTDTTEGGSGGGSEEDPVTTQQQATSTTNPRATTSAAPVTTAVPPTTEAPATTQTPAPPTSAESSDPTAGEPPAEGQ